MTNPSEYLLNYTPQVQVDLSKVVTIDFETFWDKADYSLRKMSMEAYIRDPRFLVHGVAIKQGDKPSVYIHGHDNVALTLSHLPLHRAIVLAQNAPFDAFILSHWFGIYPARIIDTQAMAAMAFGNNLKSFSLWYLTKTFLPGMTKDAQVLDDTSGKRVLNSEEIENMRVYALGDVDKEWALFKLFLPLIDLSPFNLDLIDLVARMFSDAQLTLDSQVLSDLIALEQVEKQRALDKSIATKMGQLRSNPKFAKLLESLGVQPPVKISPTTGKETFAFAKDDRQFARLLRHEDERVRDLVAARLRCKTSINETRAQSYLEVAHRGTWPVHLYVSGANTTHRLSGGSGGGGNPQNLGKTSPLRAAITAPPGYTIMAIDSANIELRGQMTLSGESRVVESLADPDVDLYSLFACEIYGLRDVTEIVKKQRDVGKVAMLSLGYGSGADKFHHTAWTWGVDITIEEAVRIVQLYRSSFPRIRRSWDACGQIINRWLQGSVEGTWFDHLARPVLEGPMGHPAIYMPSVGLYLTYPNLAKEFDEDSGGFRVRYDTYDHTSNGRLVRKDLYGAKLYQHIIQAMCRNVLVAQSLATDHFLRQEIDHRCRTVMHVHDEGVHLIPVEADLDAAKAGALAIYGTSPSFWPDLPTRGEAAFGANYATAKP